jgi:hypothetical protein
VNFTEKYGWCTFLYCELQSPPPKKMGDGIKMSSIHSVKVHIKCSSKVKFGNSHLFSSKLNYISTVTVPLLTDVCQFRALVGLVVAS